MSIKKIGFLGCGKIGQEMVKDLITNTKHEITFIQDPFLNRQNEFSVPVLSTQDVEFLKNTDLIIETATADVLKENIDKILQYCDVMIFSVTAFCDQEFYDHVQELVAKYQHKIFLPHGAILGVDGIADGRKIIDSISIETVKNPKSLSRTDEIRTVVYEGSARGACKAYPRNVNVHATVALAGIGFEKTHSTIISDPNVSTNTHNIIVDGEGIHFELMISSFSTGGVTGKYTPYSAVASMHRVLNEDSGICFV